MKKRNIKRNNSKKAQSIMGMPFSMIFSIILMIIFIVVAFVAIRYFLTWRECGRIGLFYNDFSNEVQRAWVSQGAEYPFKATLPAQLEYICFANLTRDFSGMYEDVVTEDITMYLGTEANLFLYPRKNSCDLPYKRIDHLDMDKITKNINPYCIEVEKGVVSFNIIKGISGTNGLVKISK